MRTKPTIRLSRMPEATEKEPWRATNSYPRGCAPRTPPHALSRAALVGALRSRGSLAQLARTSIVRSWKQLLLEIVVRGHFTERAARLPHEIALDQTIQVAVQHAIDVANLLLRPVVLHQLIWMEHVAPDLAAERNL